MNNQPSTSSAPVPWKRVAVFVSSTFSDMHAERDYLVKRVFPDLHDWCERRRLRLVDVDLRWEIGVTPTNWKDLGRTLYFQHGQTFENRISGRVLSRHQPG